MNAQIAQQAIVKAMTTLGWFIGMTLDWQAEVEKELKTARFCPNCGHLVKIKLRERKYYLNFFACERCGEVILTTGEVRKPPKRYDD
jgi:predicted RNA-binding Zn-ribbon protein involved in translation (DUF1610 family)